MDPRYWQGVLQLRNPSQEIIDFVADAIEKNGKIWIAKTIRQPDGIDLQLSSNAFLKEIGRKLKQRFPGELVLSKKMHTQDKFTSKSLYRGCVLFRHYPIRKGEKITHKGDEIEVIAIGREILAKDVHTHKKIRIKFSELR